MHRILSVSWKTSNSISKSSNTPQPFFIFAVCSTQMRNCQDPWFVLTSYRSSRAAWVLCLQGAELRKEKCAEIGETGEKYFNKIEVAVAVHFLKNKCALLRHVDLEKMNYGQGENVSGWLLCLLNNALWLQIPCPAPPSPLSSRS